MKGRDLAVLALIVLVAGFAAADALRNSSSTRPPGETTTGPSPESGPRPQPEPPPGWPAGTLRGTLVFTDASDCRARVIALAGGTERPVPEVRGDCRLWAAPSTQRIAVGLQRGFAVANLARPAGREFFRLAGPVNWSPDGQHFAWCDTSRTGFEAEFGGLQELRRLDGCPAAYTPDGKITYAIGKRLVVGRQTVLRASGDITAVHWGTDGSVGLTVDARRFERWAGRRMTGSFDIPGRYVQQDDPIPSPDNCAAIVRDEDPEALEILTLGCFPPHETPEPLIFGGHSAAWSPDGRWIAIAERRNITFVQVVGEEQVTQWPATAVELSWRGA